MPPSPPVFIHWPIRCQLLRYGILRFDARILPSGPRIQLDPFCTPRLRSDGSDRALPGALFCLLLLSAPAPLFRGLPPKATLCRFENSPPLHVENLPRLWPRGEEPAPSPDWATLLWRRSLPAASDLSAPDGLFRRIRASRLRLRKRTLGAACPHTLISQLASAPGLSLQMRRPN
jgi:hypothetical protein